MLTADTDAPVVTETTVGADLLQALKILTELVVQEIGHHLTGLAWKKKLKKIKIKAVFTNKHINLTTLVHMRDLPGNKSEKIAFSI